MKRTMSDLTVALVMVAMAMVRAGAAWAKQGPNASNGGPIQWWQLPKPGQRTAERDRWRANNQQAL